MWKSLKAWHACRRRVYLPSDLCEQEGVSPEEILQGRNLAGVSSVAYAVACHAKVSGCSSLCARVSECLQLFMSHHYPSWEELLLLYPGWTLLRASKACRPSAS